MSHPRRRFTFLTAATAAVLATTGCQPAAMSGIPGAPTPAPVAASAPVAPTAIGVPPAQPKPRGTRLQGQVMLNEAPIPGATLRAYDLASGKALALVAAGAGNLVAAGAGNYALHADAPPVSSADGRFDLALPEMQPNQVAKIVATQGDKTLVTLVDGMGRAIGAETPPAPYTVAAAGGTFAVTVRFRMNASTSAAAKAFEGTVKLSFQLGDGAAEGLEEAIDAAMAAVAKLEEEFANDPTIQDKLASAMNEQGEITDLAAFQAAIQDIGAVHDLADSVKATLKGFVDEGDPEISATLKASLDPVTSEDFPVGEVDIDVEGEFTFTDDDGNQISGTIADGVFKPTLEPEPTDDTTDGGGDSGNQVGRAQGGLDVHDGQVVDPEGSEGMVP